MVLWLSSRRRTAPAAVRINEADVQRVMRLFGAEGISLKINVVKSGNMNTFLRGQEANISPATLDGDAQYQLANILLKNGGLTSPPSDNLGHFSFSLLHNNSTIPVEHAFVAVFDANFRDTPLFRALPENIRSFAEPTPLRAAPIPPPPAAPVGDSPH